MIKYPLIDSFKLIQGASPPLELTFQLEEDFERQKRTLINRIDKSSTGACFMINGYKGVGKTNFVDSSINQLRENLGQNLISIKINISRDLSEPKELMHQIIRGFYNAHIEGKARAIIDMAYLRSNFRIEKTTENVSGKSTKNEIRGQIDGGVFGIAKLKAVFGLEKNEHRDRRLAEQYSYLDYDDKNAEQDIIEIANALGNQTLILILDELDKLSLVNNIKLVLDNILSSVKNILSGSQIIFIFIAGKDFHDTWLIDKKEEDSYYESIFSYVFYIGKQWDLGMKLIQKFILSDGFKQFDREELDKFRFYLNFKSRGILRMAIKEFNKHIIWENDKAYLQIGDNGYGRIVFYGDLQKSLQENLERLICGACNASLEQRDKDRIIHIIYEKIDEVLDGSSFSIIDFKTKDPNEQDKVSKVLRSVFDFLKDKAWVEELQDKKGIYKLAKVKRSAKSKVEGLDVSDIDRDEANKLRESELLTDRAIDLILRAERTIGEPEPDLLQEAEKKLRTALSLNPDNERAKAEFNKIAPYLPDSSTFSQESVNEPIDI